MEDKVNTERGEKWWEPIVFVASDMNFELGIVGSTDVTAGKARIQIRTGRGNIFWMEVMGELGCCVRYTDEL